MFASHAEPLSPHADVLWNTGYTDNEIKDKAVRASHLLRNILESYGTVMLSQMHNSVLIPIDHR